MQALRVHAVKIEDLTPVSNVPAGAYIELSGGRRISASSFANVISNIILDERVLPLINGEAQSRVEADNALSDRITAEATARENAISNLSQIARGYAPKSRLDTLNGLSQLGLWRIGNSPSMTSSQSNYGNVLVFADYGNYVHQMYFGSLDPNTWATPESGKKQNIYGRSYYNNAWSEWERVNGDKSDIIDLGEFERSGEGEAKAATLKYCADPNILFMKYTITGKGVATIQQSVVGSRCQQLLFLEGQWFTRYISFTTASREIILQVTAWWRTMATNVDYDMNSRRVRLVDYNRAHSLPNNNPNTDGFVLPLATESTAGLMSGDDKKKLNSADSLRALYVAAGAAYSESTKTYSLNGVADITEGQMTDIYANARGMFANSRAICYGFANSTTVRTNYPALRRGSWVLEIDATDLFYGCSAIEVAAIGTPANAETRGGEYCTFASLVEAFYGCSSLVTISGVLQPCSASHGIFADAFAGCTALKEVRILGLKQDVSFADCPELSYESLYYLINMSAHTSEIEVEVNEATFMMLHGRGGGQGHTAQEWNALADEAARIGITLIQA